MEMKNGIVENDYLMNDLFKMMETQKILLSTIQEWDANQTMESKKKNLEQNVKNGDLGNKLMMETASTRTLINSVCEELVEQKNSAIENAKEIERESKLALESIRRENMFLVVKNEDLEKQISQTKHSNSNDILMKIIWQLTSHTEFVEETLEVGGDQFLQTILISMVNATESQSNVNESAVGATIGVLINFSSVLKGRYSFLKKFPNPDKLGGAVCLLDQVLKLFSTTKFPRLRGMLLDVISNLSYELELRKFMLEMGLLSMLIRFISNEIQNNNNNNNNTNNEDDMLNYALDIISARLISTMPLMRNSEEYRQQLFDLFEILKRRPTPTPTMTNQQATSTHQSLLTSLYREYLKHYEQ